MGFWTTLSANLISICSSLNPLTINFLVSNWRSGNTETAFQYVLVSRYVLPFSHCSHSLHLIRQTLWDISYARGLAAECSVPVAIEEDPTACIPHSVFIPYGFHFGSDFFWRISRSLNFYGTYDSVSSRNLSFSRGQHYCLLWNGGWSGQLRFMVIPSEG